MEADEQKQYFETARAFMELATDASEETAATLERCSVKYFWLACGMERKAMSRPT